MQINGKEMEEFIDDAQLGLVSKDEVLEMLDAVTGVLDDINSEITMVEDFLQQVDVRDEGDTTDKDKLKELAPTYGIKPEDIDELESNRKRRAEVAGIMTELEKIRDTFKNFNKQNCFANIRALLKENPDIKIGMIEKEAGIRLGYMARLEKADNTPYFDGKPQHILMKHAQYTDIVESGYPELVMERAEFNSLFFNDNMKVDMVGNVYHVELPRTDTVVYVAHIMHENDLPFADDQYEVQILQEGNLTGLCGSCQSVDEIKKQIIRLYKTIEDMNSGLRLNDSIKNALGFYMTNSSPSVEKKRQSSFSSIDDELPFN